LRWDIILSSGAVLFVRETCSAFFLLDLVFQNSEGNKYRGDHGYPAEGKMSEDN
jgi:hypothetical protein